jgi:hypothetical protein
MPLNEARPILWKNLPVGILQETMKPEPYTIWELPGRSPGYNVNFILLPKGRVI